MFRSPFEQYFLTLTHTAAPKMAVDETIIATNTAAAIVAPIIIRKEPLLVLDALLFVGVVRMEGGGVMMDVLEITKCEHSIVSV